MYVEISPRQSGKSDRLTDSVIEYLRQNAFERVSIVTPSISRSKHLKETIRKKLFTRISTNWVGTDESLRLLIDDYYLERIFVTSDVKKNFGYNIGYFYFDDFSYMEPRKILLNNQIVTNGYYCTTPSEKRSTINMITNYCLNNDIEIKFFNPWTESRIMEQEGFDNYIREHILDEWVSYMETIGIDTKKLKENWVLKWVKKHNFV